MQDKLLNLIKQHTPNLKRVQMDLSLENEQLKLAQEIVKLFAIPDVIKSVCLEGNEPIECDQFTALGNCEKCTHFNKQTVL